MTQKQSVWHSVFAWIIFQMNNNLRQTSWLWLRKGSSSFFSAYVVCLHFCPSWVPFLALAAARDRKKGSDCQHLFISQSLQLGCEILHSLRTTDSKWQKWQLRTRVSQGRQALTNVIFSWVKAHWSRRIIKYTDVFTILNYLHCWKFRIPEQFFCRKPLLTVVIWQEIYNVRSHVQYQILCHSHWPSAINEILHFQRMHSCTHDTNVHYKVYT